jgi:hypothetical protein
LADGVQHGEFDVGEVRAEQRSREREGGGDASSGHRVASASSSAEVNASGREVGRLDRPQLAGLRAQEERRRGLHPKPAGIVEIRFAAAPSCCSFPLVNSTLAALARRSSVISAVLLRKSTDQPTGKAPIVKDMHSVTAPAQLLLPTGEWQLDLDRSRLGFSVEKLAFGTVRGHFRDAAASITVTPEQTVATGSLRVAGIDT